MPTYAPPLDDMLYILRDLLDAEPALAKLGYDTPMPLMGEVLREAGRFCAAVAKPLTP